MAKEGLPMRFVVSTVQVLALVTSAVGCGSNGEVADGSDDAGTPPVGGPSLSERDSGRLRDSAPAPPQSQSSPESGAIESGDGAASSPTSPFDEPGDSTASLVPESDGLSCNGAVENCDRALVDVSLALAHDSFAVGSILFGGVVLPPSADQDHPIAQQLADGMRVLRLGTHLLGNRVELCHSSCAIPGADFGTLADYLGHVRDFLDGHPTEVVLIVDESSADEGAVMPVYRQVFGARPDGSAKHTHRHTKGAPWPTLRQLIAADERLVVFADNATWNEPWYIPEFTQGNVWQSPWKNYEANDVRCHAADVVNGDSGRGDETSSFFLFNHAFYSNFAGAIDHSDPTKAPVGLGPPLNAHAVGCWNSVGARPNFLNVDFYEGYNAPSNLFPLLAALNVAHRFQWPPAGAPSDTAAASLSSVNEADGTLRIFVVTERGDMFTRNVERQDSYALVARDVRAPVDAVLRADRRVQVFASHAGGGITTFAQRGANSAKWSDAALISADRTGPRALIGASGDIELFASGASGGVGVSIGVHVPGSPPEIGWSSWTDLALPIAAGDSPVALRAAGHTVVISRGADAAIRTIARADGTNVWSDGSAPEANLGGLADSPPVAVVAADGSIDLVMDGGGSLWHRKGTIASGDMVWSDWITHRDSSAVAAPDMPGSRPALLRTSDDRLLLAAAASSASFNILGAGLASSVQRTGGGAWLGWGLRSPAAVDGVLALAKRRDGGVAFLYTMGGVPFVSARANVRGAAGVQFGD